MELMLYCHHCKKTYKVTQSDVGRMLRFDPEHMTVSHRLYSYSGGCFFKTLNQLKRLETRSSTTGEA